MEISLNSDKKIDILLFTLKERYESLSRIRERIQNICILTLGIQISIVGWLINSNLSISTPQKYIYLFGILISFIVLRFLYLEDLHKGFKGQQLVAAHIEKSLGLFEEGLFTSSGLTIYPKNWADAGTVNGKGMFIDTNYSLLYIGTFFLMVTILLKGVCF
jgi:hypothetical protein